MTDQLTIEYRRLDEVAALRWRRNPKLHDIGAIVESIRRHGFIDPPGWDVTLNGGAGGLLYGNGRDEALEWMHAQGDEPPRGIQVDSDGMWLMPVKVGVDQVSEVEAEAAAIAHNNLSLSGGDFTAYDMARMWDASYTDILAGLATADALPITVDGDALDALLAGINQVEPGAQEGDDDAPAIDLDKPTRVQPGDVWKVGGHIVACLDSTTRENVERWAHGVSFVVADPPYGIDIVKPTGLAGNNWRRGSGEGLGAVGGAKPFGSIGSGNIIPTNLYPPVIGDDSPATAIDAALLSLDLYPKAVQFWWGANNYANALPPSTCWIVWDKENSTNDFADAELAWSNHKSAVRIFKHMWNGLMKASERGERRTHPTQKPRALMRWLFERYGKTGDVVFDPFLGSGPTIKAAHELGDRTVIGFDLSPHYCTHIIEWAEAEGLSCEHITE